MLADLRDGGSHLGPGAIRRPDRRRQPGPLLAVEPATAAMTASELAEHLEARHRYRPAGVSHERDHELRRHVLTHEHARGPGAAGNAGDSRG